MSRADQVRRREHRKEKKRNRQVDKPVEIVRPMSLELPNQQLIKDPAGYEKMSGVLLELVAPWWDECEDDEACRQLLELGVISWNLSLLPEHDRTKALQKAEKPLPRIVRESLETMVKLIMLRKLEKFPDLHRKILDFEMIKMRSGGLHVNVKSTMD